MLSAAKSLQLNDILDIRNSFLVFSNSNANMKKKIDGTEVQTSS